MTLTAPGMCVNELHCVVVQVVEGIPVPVGGEDGLESVRLGLAAMKSMAENRPVNISEIET